MFLKPKDFLTIIESAAEEQKKLEQEIDFELGERKSFDFLDQQEEIRAAQKIMSVDGNSLILDEEDEIEQTRRDEKNGLYGGKTDFSN